MVICELNRLRPFLSTWWTLVHLENSLVFCEGACIRPRAAIKSCILVSEKMALNTVGEAEKLGGPLKGDFLEHWNIGNYESKSACQERCWASERVVLFGPKKKADRDMYEVVLCRCDCERNLAKVIWSSLEDDPRKNINVKRFQHCED